MLHDPPEDVHPRPSSQLAGHVAPAPQDPPPGQLTSHAQADGQVTPRAQLLTPLQLTEQSLDLQSITPPHDERARQRIAHADEVPQSTGPAQLPALPPQLISHTLAFAQSTPLGQGLLPVQLALHGMPGGHVIESQPVPQLISHTPALHVPAVQTVSHAA